VLGLGVAVGLGLWALASLRRGCLTWVRSPLSVAALLFGLAAAASITYSTYRFLTISEFGRLAANLGLFALGLVSLRRLDQIRRVIAAACLAAVPVCAYGFLQAAGADPVWGQPEARGLRVFSFLGNPTYLGGFLALLIPLAVAAGWAGRRANAQGRGSWLGPVLFFAAALMMLVCLYLTFCLAAVIGLGLGALLALAVGLARAGRRTRLLALLGVLVAGGAIAAGLAFIYPRMPQR